MKDYFSDVDLVLSDNKEIQFNNEVQNSESKESDNVNIDILSPQAVIAKEGIELIKEMTKDFTQYKICKEHEITERYRIKAELSAITQKINANKEYYINLIDKNFEERKNLFEMYEGALKKAVDEGDKEMLKIVANFMLSVYEKDPKINFLNK